MSFSVQCMPGLPGTIHQLPVAVPCPSLRVISACLGLGGRRGDGEGLERHACTGRRWGREALAAGLACLLGRRLTAEKGDWPKGVPRQISKRSSD